MKEKTKAIVVVLLSACAITATVIKAELYERKRSNQCEKAGGEWRIDLDRCFKPAEEIVLPKE